LGSSADFVHIECAPSSAKPIMLDHTIIGYQNKSGIVPRVRNPAISEKQRPRRSNVPAPSPRQQWQPTRSAGKSLQRPMERTCDEHREYRIAL
jgi:hypothetical protein